jgi:Reverse transcriptase (RNA-dependent DNA polymerase)
MGWDAQQIDVKTAFLYGLLPEDEIQYMEQPVGFEEPGKEDWVWQLQQGLYGIIIATVHVDDYLSIADSKEENECFKDQMQKV